MHTKLRVLETNNINFITWTQFDPKFRYKRIAYQLIDGYIVCHLIDLGSLCGVHRLSFKWARKMYVFVFFISFYVVCECLRWRKTDFGLMLVILLSNRMEFNLFLLKRHFLVIERITYIVCHQKCWEFIIVVAPCAIWWYSRYATIEYKFSWNNDGTLIMSKSKSQKFRIIIIEINWFIRCDAMHYHIRFGQF